MVIFTVITGHIFVMIKKSISFLLLTVVLTVGIFSCKKADDRPAPPQAEQEYFPLELGKWVIYDVDSTIWDDTFCVEKHYKYQMMYTVADTFTDDIGRASYRIDTRIRRFPEDQWQTHQVLYATNTNTEVELVQDKLRYIKLVFPIQEAKTWEGNNYILTDDPELAHYKDWMYQYGSVGHSFNTDFKVFDKTITVLQVDKALSDPEIFPEVYATRTFGKEVYASEVGMVYREYYRWVYDPETTKCRKGEGVVMRAVDHN